MDKSNKLHELYKEMNNINTEEFFRLISNAENEEEREFFIMITDVILKQKQRKVIMNRINSENTEKE